MPEADNSGNEEGNLDTIVESAELKGTVEQDPNGESPNPKYRDKPKLVGHRTGEVYEENGADKQEKSKPAGKKIPNHSGIAAILAGETNVNKGKAFGGILAEYGVNDASLSERLTSKGNEEEKYEPGHAALVFIYNEETGEGIFERKPFSYSHKFEGQGNMLAFYGGHIEPGEMPDAAARREILEEVSEGAARIIVKHIDPNARFVGIEYVDGIPVKNWVFEAKIPLEEWNQIKFGHSIADAGDMVVKPLEEIAVSKGKWAFYHYDFAMKFVRDYIHYPVEWTPSPGIKFKESYALSKSFSLPGIATEFKPAPLTQLKYAA